MATVLNFDAITVATIDVTKGGKVYALRDDVPAEVLLRQFKLVEMRQAVGDTPTYDSMTTYLAQQDAELLDVCTAIFQNTYPDMTQADVEKLLNAKERKSVCEAFFSLLFSSSSAQSNATPAPVATTPPASMEATAAESAPTIASLPSSSPSSEEVATPA